MAAGLIAAVALLGACGGDDEGDDTGSEAQPDTTAATESSVPGSSEPAAPAAGDDSVTHHLETAGTEYAAGNAAEARTHYDEAVAAWQQLSATVDPAEATEIQTQLDALGGQLDGSVPAADVTALITQLTQQLAGR